MIDAPGDVPGHRDEPLAQLGGEPIEPGAVPVQPDDPPAALHQQPSDALPDAVGRAGDHRHLTAYVHPPNLVVADRTSLRSRSEPPRPTMSGSVAPCLPAMPPGFLRLATSAR